ncbi:MAG: radical SAM protein [bacterium]
MEYRYVFGPVHSRRMGYSLGIDPVPRKLCSMDCVYCEVGKTDRWTMERREWVPPGEILEEVRSKLGEEGRVDCITFSGSGEPVLHSRLGEMIDAIHEMSELPVYLLTNGSWMHDEEVRKEIRKADAVAPSLDAVTPEVFEAVCKPHPELRVEDVVEGLVALRSEYEGPIWLEMLFVSGLNDTEEEVRALAEAAYRIDPDRIDINTVARPPAYENTDAVSYARLKEIEEMLGPKAGIVKIAPSEAHAVCRGDAAAAIQATAMRRPLSRSELSDILGMDQEELELPVRSLVQTGRLRERVHEGVVYLEAPETAHPRRPPRLRRGSTRPPDED